MKYLVLVLVLFISSCGTIINGYTASYNIQTEPSDVQIKLVDEKRNTVIYEGDLKPYIEVDRLYTGAEGARYKLEFTKSGYETSVVYLQARTSSWTIFGNIWTLPFFYGGYIADLATGGAYYFETIYVNEADKLKTNGPPSIRVMLR